MTQRMRRWAVSLGILLLAATGCSSSGAGDAPPSADSALAALTVSAGTLSPSFAADVVTYAVTVSNGTATFQVTPTARAAVYGVYVKQGSGPFAAVPPGAPSQAYPVPAPGTPSSLVVRVIAADQIHSSAYTIALNQERALFANASLASLALDAGSLGPAFVSSTTDYTATVPYGTPSLTVTPAVAERHATVQVRQGTGPFVAVASGSASAALAVPAYPTATSVTVRVTAEDGTTKDYTIAVSQAAPSSDATLQALAISGASLTPAFAAGTLPYAATLANGTATFSVTATAAEPHATIQVKQDAGAFAAVASASASPALPAPAAGAAASVVTVRVTAQDGATSRDYVIAVDQTTSLSTVNTLDGLAVSGAALAPGFSPGTLAYAVVLPNPTATFTVTPTATDSHASVEVQQDTGAWVAVASGSASAALSAPPGDGATSTAVHVRVTPQDGAAATQTYSVTVTQAAPSADATLAALAVSGATLSPAFSAATDAYTAALPYGTSTFTVTATLGEAHGALTVQQDGGAAQAVASGAASPALTAPAAGSGSTVVTIHATAQDGVHAHDTTITVTQLGAPVEVAAFFPLWDTSVTVSTLPTLTGDVTAEEVLGGMEYGSAKNGTTNAPVTVWHDVTGAATTTPSTVYQRVQAAGGGWPVETDIAPGRWVEFAVSTSSTKTLTIDAVGAFTGSGGGTAVLFRVQYSTQADFGGARELPTMSVTGAASLPTGSIVKNDMYDRVATGQSIVVSPGSTFRLRFLPWMSSGTAPVTGKYLQLQSVTIHGHVQ